VAVVAIGVSQYIAFLTDAIGLDLPAWMLGAPGTGDGHRIDLIAVLLSLGVACLITKLQPATWVRFAVWFLIGVVIYAAYGYRHSELGKASPCRPRTPEAGNHPCGRSPPGDVTRSGVSDAIHARLPLRDIVSGRD